MVPRSVLVAGGAVTGAAGAYCYRNEQAREAVPNSWMGLLRLTRTCGNVLVTAVDYKVSLHNLDKEEDYETYKDTLRRVNKRAAKRLYNVCKQNGGLYTKFGQTIANLNHVLPEEFVKTLAPLQDKALEMEPQVALDAINKELGQDWSNLFSEFDSKPVAAASLAQVHRAVLKHSNEEVAIKIQYPYLQDQVQGDIATLKIITDFVGFFFPDNSYSWLTPEFENNMALELDFQQEGRNGERLAQLFSHRKDVYVPRIHWPLTTKRMLIMEYVHGDKITDLDSLEDKGINPLEVAATVSAVFGDMIHVHGFAHCDPHPGNLMIRPAPKPKLFDTMYAKLSWTCFLTVPVAMVAATIAGPGSIVAYYGAATALAATVTGEIVSLLSADENSKKISNGGKNGEAYQLVILDHGMYRRFEPEFRTTYCQLWQSLLMADIKHGKQAAIKLGVPSDGYDVLSLIFTHRPANSQTKIGKRMQKAEREKMRAQFKDVSAADINVFLQNLPRDLLFVLRCTNIVRSINLSLGGTTRGRFKVMGESAVRGLLIPNPTDEAFEAKEASNPDISYTGAYKVNLPVASEIVDANSITYKQAFEIWRLRTYLSLIDGSWAIAAKIVQWM